MDTPVGLFKGTCSCGWVSNGFGTEHQARKMSKDHVRASNDNARRQIEQDAEAANVTPTQVIEAAWPLIHHYDLASVSWEHHTTVIAVFAGDGGSVAIRYTLTADLRAVAFSDRVRAIK